MSAPACRHAATGYAERYGELWCASCLACIEFEERLAISNGMVVRDVFIADNGEVAFVLDETSDQPFVKSDYKRLTVTEGEVLMALADAIVAMKQKCTVVGDRVAVIARGAEVPARRYLELAAKYETLLGSEERRDAVEMCRIARMIVDSIAANTN